MSGRYVRQSDKQKIAEWFHADPQPADLPMPAADYNLAPTTYQPIVRQSREAGGRELVLARGYRCPLRLELGCVLSVCIQAARFRSENVNR